MLSIVYLLSLFPGPYHSLNMKLSELFLYSSSSQNLESQLEQSQLQAELSGEEFEKLRMSFVEIEDENENLTTRLKSMEALMEPFKDQLEAYKLEMLQQREGKMANETQCREIFTKYAELLGHQNSRQKIHHIIKLKEDNLKAKKVSLIRFRNDCLWR